MVLFGSISRAFREQNNAGELGAYFARELGRLASQRVDVAELKAGPKGALSTATTATFASDAAAFRGEGHLARHLAGRSSTLDGNREGHSRPEAGRAPEPVHSVHPDQVQLLALAD
jgi:hypothetical protein